MVPSGGLLCPAQWRHRYRKIPVHACGRLSRDQRDWKGDTVSPGDWGRSWKKQGNTVRAVKSATLGVPRPSLHPSVCRNAALGEKKKNVQDQDTRPVAFQIFHASWSHAGVIIILYQHQMASKPPLPLPRPASTPAPARIPCLDRCAGARAVRRREPRDQPKSESGPHLEKLYLATGRASGRIDDGNPSSKAAQRSSRQTPLTAWGIHFWVEGWTRKARRAEKRPTRDQGKPDFLSTAPASFPQEAVQSCQTRQGRRGAGSEQQREKRRGHVRRL